MKLTRENQIIRVVVRATGIAGSVVGTSDGLIGVLLDTGEYIDVEEAGLKKLYRRRKHG